MASPSDELAKKICERLCDEGLLTLEEEKRFSEGLAAGKVKAEDWRLAVEKTIDSKEDL
jgi:polyhydroxyalkanoate synthesis regulator phasin